MLTHLDHVTVVVRDVEKAKEFFGSISGEKFEKYMNVAGIKAEPFVIPTEAEGSLALARRINFLGFTDH